MSKLKNIIKQLSENDFQQIYDSLIEHEATKSAYLLRFLREKKLNDKSIMAELDVNPNAFYTLRSRLNQKIEEHLLKQMQSPRTDLIKKVANINEILFTKKRAIAIATLKKLEKELLDYDLSNELTIVYKALKKLHINSPEYFNYSQLYNRHVAYMLAVDKAEDMLAEYFKAYGQFLLSDEQAQTFALKAIYEEMENVTRLYKSHRLFVYQCCIKIFHKLFIEPEHTLDDDEPIEDLFDMVEDIFENYYLDSTYYNIKIVFEYLKLLYYNNYKVYRKAEKYFQEINPMSAILVTNYGLFTFPGHFFIIKLQRHKRLELNGSLEAENDKLFENFRPDVNDIPNFYLYTIYRALSCVMDKKYEVANEWLNELTQKANLKKFPKIHLEVKLLSLYMMTFAEDTDMIPQMTNSIQRQIRLIGKEDCACAVQLVKLVKLLIADREKDSKIAKAQEILTRIELIGYPAYSPFRHLDLREKVNQHLETNLVS